ncbi:MAG: RNA methyltransferase [Acidobacteriota bacterium]
MITGVLRIRGLDDPRIADYRGIADAALVRSRGLFVAEGRAVVRRLIEDGRYPVRSVLVSDAAYRALETILAPAARQTPAYLCQAGDFLGITGHDLHRGCLALAERPPAPTVADLLTPIVARTRAGGARATIVVLEGISNADNVGGVFRNAAAFGADAVVLSPTCCDPLYRKAIRTSMAATLRVPYARAAEWPGDLERIRRDGFTILALTPRPPSITIDELADRPRPPHIAWLVGTEGEGLTAAAASLADHHVRIPIEPEVDSLNLAVAVGIALQRLR